MSFTLTLDRYKVQHETEWPCRGRSILSQYDNETIIVYQTLFKQVNGTSNELYTCSNGLTDIEKEVVGDACKEIDSDQWKEASLGSELGDVDNEDESGVCKEVKESPHNFTVEDVELCSERLDVDKEVDACSNRHDVDKALDRSYIQGNNQLNETSSQRDGTTKYAVMGTNSIEYTDDLATTSEAACTEDTDDYTEIVDEDSQGDEFVWLHTSFVRTVYDCGWETMSRHGMNVIAILLKKEGFDEILKSYVDEFKNGRQTENVMLQWSPDRSLRGEMLKRLVPRIGIRGDVLVKFKHKWTLGTKDISEYIEHQKRLAHTGKIDSIWTPKERDYVPISLEIRGILRLQCEDSVQTKDKDHSDIFEHGSLTDTLAEVYSAVTENARDAIFYLYGAFNPMHSGHVSAIVDGKHWLENTANYNVIETRVAVATDGTVLRKTTKTNDICIKFEHRRKLCENACSRYPWIKIHPLPVDSQLNYGKQIRIELDKPYAKLVLLMGSDRASFPCRRVGELWAENRFILCVGRKGMNASEKQKFEDAKKNNPNRSHAFYVVPTKQNDISSTGIRKKLMQFKAGTSNSAFVKGSHIINCMVERDWLTEDEGEYILQNIHNLYLPK